MLALGAEIEFHPVMVLEDLGKASAQLERVAQKYGQDAACLDATGPGSRGALALLHDLIHRSAWKGDSTTVAIPEVLRSSGTKVTRGMLPLGQD